MTQPTNEQRKAIEAYVKGTLSPLIESVLTKQLGMAAVFLRDELQGRSAHLTDEQIEFGLNNQLEDPSDAESAAFTAGARWAAAVLAGPTPPGDGLQARIRELVAQHGSIRAAARVLMVDHAYLYRLSTGEKDDPGDDLLRKLKLRRVVSFEPVGPVAASLATNEGPNAAGWQPIETAPKDGRWLLITNGSQLEYCYWDGGMNRRFPWRNRGGNGWLADWPTHWMPQPHPPVAASLDTTSPDGKDGAK